MFIDLRLKATNSCRFRWNTAIKAFEFIGLGI
jgi:hypothetical protein